MFLEEEKYRGKKILMIYAYKFYFSIIFLDSTVRNLNLNKYLY